MPNSNITLKDFITQFVAKNTLVRLWTKEPEGSPFEHKQVKDLPKDFAEMEWKLIKSEYKDRTVLYITDILVLNWPEAVNIVIE